MKNHFIRLVLFSGILIGSPPGFCDVPDTISIRGALQSPGEAPVAGVREYRIRFFASELGGPAIENVTGVVAVSDSGRFSFELAPSQAVLEASEVWYELAIDISGDGVDQDDVFPNRVRVHSVPFALLSADSQRLGDIPAAEYPTEMELGNALAGKAATDHDHLGQTWEGNRNPLTITGSFPDRNIIIMGKSGVKGTPGPKAPLILGNTSTNGHGLVVNSEGTGATLSGGSGFLTPDLVLGGEEGILRTEESGELLILSHDNVRLLFNLFGGSESSAFSIQAPGGIVATFNEAGNLVLLGEVVKSAGISKIDHPLDPANKYLLHSSVESPERKNVYDGLATLDEDGEAIVSVPGYFEAFNSDHRFQLTPIGAPAPNLHVAQEIEDNRFLIAGGKPGMKVSWMVTGVRRDAYAKANPIQVEKEKADDEKGKYLHPELFGEPNLKSLPLSQSE